MSEHPIEDVYPLSPLQAGLLSEALVGDGVYVGQWCGTFAGALDADAFEQAWCGVVDRHTALRTGFDWKRRAEPFQYVLRRAEPEFARHDWSGLPAAEQESARAAFLAADRERGFDLGKPPLLRFALLRLGPDRWDFVWTRHHLVVDGWSLALLWQEALERYAALAAGRPAAFPAATPYRLYVEESRRQDRAAARQHWRARLAGFEPPTPLPADWPGRAGRPDGRREMTERSALLPAAEAAQLRRFARAHGLTPSTLLQGAWALILGRHGGVDDVVFGVTCSGRSAALPGSESMVGLLINTLPLRTRLDNAAPVAPWLRQLQAEAVALREHEVSPLDRLPEWAGLPRGVPLFESVLLFQNYPQSDPETEAAPGLRLAAVEDRSAPHNALSLVAEARGEMITLRAIFDAARLSPAAAGRLLRQVGDLLGELAAPGERLLRDLPLLGLAERHQLLYEWNDTGAAGPEQEEIELAHRLFERQAAERPDRVAFVQGNLTLSYGELARRTDRLARRLEALGAGPEVRVGVALAPSPEAISALFAVLAAGAAYVPFAPDLPPARLAGLAADAGLRLLVHGPDFQGGLPAGIAGVCLDGAGDGPDRAAFGSRKAAPDPDGLAYVIHTSGSSGRPKGVMVSHRSLAASLAARRRAFPEPVDRWLLLMPLAFDGSLPPIFGTLTTGGELHLPPAGDERQPPRLAALIEERRISHLLAVPALHGLLLATPAAHGSDGARLASLRTCLVAGEACPAELARAHRAALPAAELVNEYGPTEGTVWCTLHRVTGAEGGEEAGATVPIGRPIPGARIHLADARGDLAPLGAAAELLLGGPGVARGYLGLPGPTADRFRPDPWSGEPGSRLYRTGDRVRHLGGGAIEFLGRIDRQVKIRGHRIEPGEIEALLASHPAVGESAVVARPRPDGSPRLVAYVAPRSAAAGLPPAEELRRFLAERLPAYMLPDELVALAAFPLTATGKLDRQALSETAETAEPAELATRPHAANEDDRPAGEVEQTVARIWGEVFQRPRIGRQEDFFALGGDSLAAMRVNAALHAAFGIALPLQRIFAAPTVARLAAEIARERPDGSGAMPAALLSARPARTAQRVRRGDLAGGALAGRA